ncbi:MAG TPA: hypothetical protein VGM89_15025 [Puia sp.]
MNRGDDICASHDGKHRVLLYRQPAVEIESVTFEMILMETMSDDRVLVFGTVGGRDRFRVGGNGNLLNAPEPGGKNQNADKDQKDVFVAAPFHVFQK